jgi:xylose dehydrogenase (NAD/NADP)
MSAPLKWGFLGASRIGRGALAPAVLGAGQTLHAVAARNLGRAEAFAQDFGFARSYGDYAALLADKDVDAVYIALPNDQHLPWTLRALANGKHVLCEKPLALTAGEVAEMQRAERESGFRVMEAFCHRFHPQFAAAREAIVNGDIGEVLGVQTSFVNVLDRPADFRWAAAMGGGALYDLGCYGVSLMRGLLDREPRAVSGVQRLRGDVDERFAAQLDFGDGIAGQVICSFEGARQQSLTVMGSTGCLTLDWPFSTKGRATLLSVAGANCIFQPMDPYQAMVEHFADAVRGTGMMRFGLEDSFLQAVVIDRLFDAVAG